MQTGTVKWFNAEKALVSSRLKVAKTYSYTLVQSLATASSRLMKDNVLNLT